MVSVFKGNCAWIIILMAECLARILVGRHQKMILLSCWLFFISCSQIFWVWFSIGWRHSLSKFINELFLINLRWRRAGDKYIVETIQILYFRDQSLVLHFLIKTSLWLNSLISLSLCSIRARRPIPYPNMIVQPYRISHVNMWARLCCLHQFRLRKTLFKCWLKLSNGSFWFERYCHLGCRSMESADAVLLRSLLL